MKVLLPLFALLILAPCPSAQDKEYTKFITDFAKAMEFNDKAGMDKAIRSLPHKALYHFQNTAMEELFGGKPEAKATISAMKDSWQRVFEDAEILDRMHRWCSGQTNQTYSRYQKIRRGLDQCYAVVADAKKDKNRASMEAARDGCMQVARAMEENGHKLDAAEAYALLSHVNISMPDIKLDDRRDSIYALERFQELRDAWNWKKDTYYGQNVSFMKAEKARIEGDAAADKKRQDEGYAADSKGIEALVMPGAEDELFDLEFKIQKAMEVDYSAKGGPLPVLWWETQFRGKDATDAKITWFTLQDVFLKRISASKFGVSTKPDDDKATQPIDVGTKPKASQFYLDTDKKLPYAMWFATGTENEMVFQTGLNLMPTPEFAPVFYKSAASWVSDVKDETITFYDDSSDGKLFQAEVYKLGFKVYSLGDPEKGAEGPLLDSMRIGKGPRVPFSEFVKLGDQWYHMRGQKGGAKVGIRPLNPEYVKVGKVKFKWSGGKKTQPVFLVIKGRGTLATAFFDVVSSKEVEVPAGEYEICFGRILSGKGPRTQLVNIYRGQSEPFTVEEGKTFELKMGAPYKIDFKRAGDETNVEIESPRLALLGSSGAVFTDLFNTVLYPEVVASRDESGKGAKAIGEFVKMDDPDFVNEAAGKWNTLGRFITAFPMPKGARRGDLKLKAKLPFKGGKVGLRIKRHPLFGKIGSEFK